MQKIQNMETFSEEFIIVSNEAIFYSEDQNKIDPSCCDSIPFKKLRTYYWQTYIQGKLMRNKCGR
jgi:hypothetical protein